MFKVVRRRDIKSAEKVHFCQSSIVHLLEHYDFVSRVVSRIERKQIQRVRENNWCILPGQPFLRFIAKVEGDDGGYFQYKCIPEIHAICVKYKIYGRVKPTSANA